MSTTVQVQGGDLFVKEAGSGPPLLLIHGTGIDADTWGDAFEDLAADHRVVAYDRRGASRSRDAGPTADWDLHAADAAAVIEQMELGRCAVAGWSGGGLIAVKLAIARPDLVERLILVEPAFEVPRNMTARYLRYFLKTQFMIRRGRQVEAYEHFMQLVCTRRGGINCWDDPEFPEERREAGRANAGAFAAEIGGAKKLPKRSDIRAIGVPVTVILGEQSDPWFAKMAHAVPKVITQASVRTVPNACHAFGFTSPHDLAAEIRAAAAAEEPVPA